MIFRELAIYLLIVGLAWVWFIPMESSWKGESPVCKFRFQVFLCDWHDYGGDGDMNDWFFRLEPKKYGRLDVYQRVGGWQEYFGFKDID